VRMNLIYSKTNFFLNVKKKKNVWTVQVNCTVHVNSASELHCSRNSAIHS